MRTVILSKTLLRIAFVVTLVLVLYSSRKARDVASETWKEVSDELALLQEGEGSGEDRVDILENIENFYHEDSEEIEEKDPIHFAAEDKKFLLHNKLPKSGSSTMKYILKVLSDKNDFFFDHYRVSQCDIDNNQRLVHHAAKLRRQHPDKKIVLLKHHTWVNFTHRGYPQPQFINVVRHPVTQFKSTYYFSRFGWGLQKGKRKSFSGSHEDRKRSIDDCVAQGQYECVDSIGVFNKYFCGTDPVCMDHRTHQQQPDGKWVRFTDHEKLKKATELSKQNILKYRQIGLLEEFDSTLKLLEVTLPEFYKGAFDAYHGPYVQKFVKLTKSKSHGNMTEETAKKLEEMLSYDMDIYNLAKQVFHQRLQENGIGSNAVAPL